MSTQFARECCVQFDLAIKQLYQKEYLRLPTKDDIKSISNLHKAVHGVEGMFGSLDCMHTFWKNCPKAWHGSYKGKENKPSIVLEAIADYHLWFWHASYGYAGTLNDKNILHLSPFLESLVDGTFIELEQSAGTVPFKVLDEEFNKMFVLVDGIYPSYSRFVRGLKEPVTDRETYFTTWQEKARKDVERAFGVLQGKFQWVARPIHLYHLNGIATRVSCCLILHNMCVSDRVMGNPRLSYVPSHNVEDHERDVQQPGDLQQIQRRIPSDDLATIGVRECPEAVQRLVTRKNEWDDLDAYRNIADCTML